MKRWVQEAIKQFESMKKMKGINGGGKTPKAGVKKKPKVKLDDATEKLNDILKKKSSQELVAEMVTENNVPKVENFLPLIEKLKVTCTPIKNGYTAVKNKEGKVLTYVRNTSYGFSIETRNEAGNWVVSKVTKHSELDNWVKEIENRLK